MLRLPTDGVLAQLPRLCSGTFDAEKSWCDETTVRLPAIADPAQERIISTLDELLFPFCPGARDVLLTRHRMPDSHRDVLRSLGFDFENQETNVRPRDALDDREVPHRYFYSPYAVVPDWEAALEAWSISNSLPATTTVRKVNSKVYSWQLRSDLGGTFGETCLSAASVGVAATAILAKGKGALIKEAYGVSGRGSLLVETSKTLERICRYIENGERRGGRVEFIVEPLLAKKEDFSCQVDLHETEGPRILGVQRMQNRGFSFGKVETVEKSFTDRLERWGYFRVIEKVGAVLIADGYFGPACVDSMLAEEGLVPVVEINARKSMGLINQTLHERMGRRSKRSTLGFHDIRVSSGASHQALIDRLEARDLLLSMNRPVGVLPLNASGITVNLPVEPSAVSPDPVAGRVYFSIHSDDAAAEERLEAAFVQVLGEVEMRVPGQ